jgi:hypothetical protein
VCIKCCSFSCSSVSFLHQNRSVAWSVRQHLFFIFSCCFVKISVSCMTELQWIISYFTVREQIYWKIILFKLYRFLLFTEFVRKFHWRLALGWVVFIQDTWWMHTYTKSTLLVCSGSRCSNLTVLSQNAMVEISLSLWPLQQVSRVYRILSWVIPLIINNNVFENNGQSMIRAYM